DPPDRERHGGRRRVRSVGTDGTRSLRRGRSSRRGAPTETAGGRVPRGTRGTSRGRLPRLLLRRQAATSRERAPGHTGVRRDPPRHGPRRRLGWMQRWSDGREPLAGRGQWELVALRAGAHPAYVVRRPLGSCGEDPGPRLVDDLAT